MILDLLSYLALATLVAFAVLGIDDTAHHVAAAAEAPAVLRPMTTCLGCERPIPAGTTWCGWLCRNVDDRHDDGDADE
ncbi:hypothetical protein QMZ92_13350 [Streptomyces sp. HNM0645]|uniref:hypothetical protein n=1 Tax=Streptomyces sp. HNM0645 TaxID=2782343 RepID=UPI0024B64ED5|nr:hypothetical protein [Streptomyces sp. HNM0645]MDI9885354.1 hypothetical protein [Streptomyces sp. HNM0645]